MAHADSTGKLRLNPRVAGLGLAACVLAELILVGRASIENGDVVIIDARPPQDLLQHSVIDRILSEPTRHPIKNWLAYLGTTAIDDVAQRLLKAGVLHAIESKKLFGGVEQRLEPVSMNDAAWPAVRLARALSRRHELELPDQTLGGIVKATGLSRFVLRDEVSGVDDRFLEQLVAGLPEPLRLLVVETEAAVARAVLSQRT
jgi:hypothetical protein